MVPVEGQGEDYKGHRIELRAPEEGQQSVSEAEGRAAPVLLIDGAPIPYGQFPDGLYSLRDYAYDWHDDLIELARRFIDYRAAADRARGGLEPGGGE